MPQSRLDDARRAFNQGVRDRREDVNDNANPFPDGTDEADYWLSGWGRASSGCDCDECAPRFICFDTEDPDDD